MPENRPQVWKSFLDEFGRVGRQLDPDENSTQLQYDGRNNITAIIDAADQLTEMFYDDRNNLREVRDALGRSSHGV